MFIIFLLLALIILFSVHYLLFDFLIRLFTITSSQVKISLAVILFFLSISFILTSILMRWQENFLTRIFYFISGLWLGVLTNLLLAIILSWLIVGLAKLLGFEIRLIVIGLIAFILAFAYSGYGVYNAYNIKIKEVEVNIKNLPASWQSKKAVVVSDLHLGHILGKNYLKDVVKRINKQEPEMVFIVGDLFDMASTKMDALIEILVEISAQAGIYFVTGNHETYVGEDKVFTALAKTRISVLADEMVELEGVQIIGLSYPTLREKKRYS